MHVSDVMTHEVAVADIKATVHDVAGIMRTQDCGFVPILEAGRLVGVVTDRDLAVRCLADDAFDGPIGDMPIAHFMTADDLVTIAPDETIAVAAHTMALRRVRRLAVTTDGIVHGVLSLGDLEQAMHGRGAAAREAVLAVTLPD